MAQFKLWGRKAIITQYFNCIPNIRLMEFEDNRELNKSHRWSPEVWQTHLFKTNKLRIPK